MNPQFFAHFGIYVRRRFLASDECRQLIAEIHSSSRTPATVREYGTQSVDRDYRSTQIAQVSAESVRRVAAAILALKPALEQHFDVHASGCRLPEFLAYGTGDFFAPHSDSIPVGQERDAVISERCISVVVFLNGESPAPDDGSYEGGALNFYGLVDDVRMKHKAFPLTGEEGLLVAFRPEVVHGVAPVTRGERYSIVTWFER